MSDAFNEWKDKFGLNTIQEHIDKEGINTLSEANIERIKAIDFNDVIEGMEESEAFEKLAEICLSEMGIDYNIDDDDDCQLHIWLTDILQKGAIEHLVKEITEKGLDKS